jgi:cytochrome P450
MVSAGLDTVPGNLIMGIAYLSSAHGQEIQKRAYEEIMKVYPDGDAWAKGLVEEKVPYVTAFVREVLRFFTVIPICLPRTSIKDIKYENAVIPAGTTFYMVKPPFYLAPGLNLQCLERLGSRLRRISFQRRKVLRRRTLSGES